MALRRLMRSAVAAGARSQPMRSPAQAVLPTEAAVTTSAPGGANAAIGGGSRGARSPV